MRKRFTIGLLLLALMAFGFGSVHAQQGTGFPPTNTITVSGFGSAFGEPDVAYVELGVEQVNESLAEAFTSTADTMNAVIDALVEMGIEPRPGGAITEITVMFATCPASPISQSVWAPASSPI